MNAPRKPAEIETSAVLPSGVIASDIGPGEYMREIDGADQRVGPRAAIAQLADVDDRQGAVQEVRGDRELGRCRTAASPYGISGAVPAAPAVPIVRRTRTCADGRAARRARDAARCRRSRPCSTVYCPRFRRAPARRSIPRRWHPQQPRTVPRSRAARSRLSHRLHRTRRWPRHEASITETEARRVIRHCMDRGYRRTARRSFACAAARAKKSQRNCRSRLAR